MNVREHSLCLIVLGALCGCAGAHKTALPNNAGCEMSASDAAWLRSAQAAWEQVSIKDLRLSAAWPRVVTFDRTCQYGFEPNQPLHLDGSRHAGVVRLPDGKSIPVAVTSFAAPDPSGRTAFFVMALPSLWRDAGIQSKLGLETLMEGVLVHEMMHTRQSEFVTPLLDGLTARFQLPEDISDDSLQQQFGSNPEYVAAYQSERDLLYEAAAEPDASKAKALAARALKQMGARHARWFTAENAKWAPLDEVFLTMEGIGQFAAFSWFKTRPGVAPDVALAEARRGGRFWTQEEGLALFLVINRFVPDWQEQSFKPNPTLGQALLAQAASR
jgi:hypothetical protein